MTYQLSESDASSSSISLPNSSGDGSNSSSSKKAKANEAKVPIVRRLDVATETDLVFSGNVLTCRKCQKPPLATGSPVRQLPAVAYDLADRQRRKLARSNSLKPVGKGTPIPDAAVERTLSVFSAESLISPSPSIKDFTEFTSDEGSFDGIWILTYGPQNVHRWLTRLEILGDAVLDGEGDLLAISRDEKGERILEEGRLVLKAGNLIRVGRSGLVMQYTKVEEVAFSGKESDGR